MQIIKIGGAVLRNANGIKRIIKIIKSYKGEKVLLIISAFHGVSNELKVIAEIAESGKLEQAKCRVSKVVGEYITFAEELIHTGEIRETTINKIKSGEQRLQELIKGITLTKGLSKRTLDSVLSFGEYFALQIVYHYLLENRWQVSSVDSSKIIFTDDDFGSAKPLPKETTEAIYEKLVPEIKRNEIVVTQGFVGRTIKGDRTTMGFESSNLTAVLFAELLGSDKITFWTDTEGIRTCDPKIVKNTSPIPRVDYDFAYTLSRNGLKLIHPEMIEHARSKGIKLIYRSALKPDGERTIIAPAVNKMNYIIVNKDNLNRYKISVLNDKDLEMAGHLILKLNDFGDDVIYISAPSEFVLYSRNKLAFNDIVFSKIIYDDKLTYSMITIFNIQDNLFADIKNLVRKFKVKDYINTDIGNDAIIRIFTEIENRDKLIKEIYKILYVKI